MAQSSYVVLSQISILDIVVLLFKQPLVMQVLSVVHAIHAVAVFFKLMAPSLYHPSYRPHEMWSIVVLNSFNLAMACR